MGILDERSKLRGRKAAIIGGADGIGKAVTLALLDSEVDVAFCDINEPALGKTKSEVEASHRKVIAEVADALDPVQLRRFYSAVEAAFGHVDIVVNIERGQPQGAAGRTADAQRRRTPRMVGPRV